MKKDNIFWGCMILNMLALFLLVILKPEVHLLPVMAMHIIIKIDMFLQIGLGFYGLWVAIDFKLFEFFAKVYGVLFLGYIILKIPALDFLNQYYIVVPGMFTPFPFVLAWIINKAFHTTSNAQGDKKNF
jgi:hypothetical protein